MRVLPCRACCGLFFFFNDTATTEIYTLSLHDALPISGPGPGRSGKPRRDDPLHGTRSEEHTSELQSHSDLVCRLLLEKKNQGESDYNARHPERFDLGRSGAIGGDVQKLPEFDSHDAPS